MIPANLKSKNNYKEKGDGSSIDIHGRMEALDQSLRSIDNRLRAVEKRLSINKNEEFEADLATEDANKELPDKELNNEIETRIAGTEEGLIKLQEKQGEIETIATRIKTMEAKLAENEQKITRFENLNKITIGKIKIPLELSGLVAAFVLIGTGYLIALDRWDVIRSSYYPAILGVLFGVVVIVKFKISGRE